MTVSLFRSSNPNPTKPAADDRHPRLKSEPTRRQKVKRLVHEIQAGVDSICSRYGIVLDSRRRH
jgi:hypothetical protein